MDEELLHYDSNIIEIYEYQQSDKVEVTKLNREKLKLALQITGLKLSNSLELSEEIFEKFFHQLKESEKDLQLIQIQKVDFSDVLISMVSQKGFIKDIPRKKQSFGTTFFLACQIIDKKSPFIILLGGTSGSGKSTLGNIIAARFGIATALSTDSIRQIMRNFKEKDSEPLLFASTYEAGKYLPPDPQNQELTDAVRVIKGYKKQCLLVQEKLAIIVKQFVEKGEPLVIEGVHLTPKFMFDCMKQHKNVMAYFLYINDEKKHRARFAVRSKYMILEKNHNKYVKNFNNIRLIQKWYQEKADQLLIPKLNNLNVDKTLEIIHKTTMRYYLLLHQKQDLDFSQMHNFLPLYEIFNKVTKNNMSTNVIKSYINSKVKKDQNYLSRMLDNLNGANKSEVQQDLAKFDQVVNSEYQKDYQKKEENFFSEQQQEFKVEDDNKQKSQFFSQDLQRLKSKSVQIQCVSLEEQISQSDFQQEYQAEEDSKEMEDRQKRDEIFQREQTRREEIQRNTKKGQEEEIQSHIMQIDENRYQGIEDLNNDIGSPLEQSEKKKGEKRRQFIRNNSLQEIRNMRGEEEEKKGGLEKQEKKIFQAEEKSVKIKEEGGGTGGGGGEMGKEINKKDLKGLKQFLMEIHHRFQNQNEVILKDFNKQNIKALRKFMFKHGFSIKFRKNSNGTTSIIKEENQNGIDLKDNLSISKFSSAVQPQISENNSLWDSTQYRIYEEEDEANNIDSDQPFDYFSAEENVNSVDDEESLNSGVLDEEEDEEEENSTNNPNNQTNLNLSNQENHIFKTNSGTNSNSTNHQNSSIQNFQLNKIFKEDLK